MGLFYPHERMAMRLGGSMVQHEAAIPEGTSGVLRVPGF